MRRVDTWGVKPNILYRRGIPDILTGSLTPPRCGSTICGYHDHEWCKSIHIENGVYENLIYWVPCCPYYCCVVTIVLQKHSFGNRVCVNIRHVYLFVHYIFCVVELVVFRSWLCAKASCRAIEANHEPLFWHQHINKSKASWHHNGKRIWPIIFEAIPTVGRKWQRSRYETGPGDTAIRGSTMSVHFLSYHYRGTWPII